MGGGEWETGRQGDWKAWERQSPDWRVGLG
jgi:hypothetical protein